MYSLFKFLQDLYSGKLHREFHYGPDQTKEDSSSDATPDRIEVKYSFPDDIRNIGVFTRILIFTAYQPE